MLVLVVFERARIFTSPSWLVKEIAPVSAVRSLLRILRSSLEVMVMLPLADNSLCFWVMVEVVVVLSVTVEFELAETLPRLYSPEKLAKS